MEDWWKHSFTTNFHVKLLQLSKDWFSLPINSHVKFVKLDNKSVLLNCMWISQIPRKARIWSDICALYKVVVSIDISRRIQNTEFLSTWTWTRDGQQFVGFLRLLRHNTPAPSSGCETDFFGIIRNEWF